MFQSVRQNSPFYILDKGENKSLKVASVESVTNPQPRYNTSYPMQPYGAPDMVVDIVVRIGEEKQEFKMLPANLSIANFGNAGIVVSDDRQAMCSEIDAWVKTSQNHLDSNPYHEDVIRKGGEMILQLNPQLAKEKAQEDRLNTLESKFDKMMDMMSDVLEAKSQTTKTE